MAIRTVATDDAARELARELQRAGRRLPVAVISIASGSSDPFVDTDEIDAAVRGLCEVVVLPAGDVSWAYSTAMPPGCQVYGGASRVYPVDLGWVHDLRRSPLRFAYGPSDRERVTEALIGDAMTAALAAGVLGSSARANPRTTAGGDVIGVVGNGALVDCDGRFPATVWPDLVAPGGPAERLFRKGMHLQGALDPSSNRLEIPRPRADVETVQQAFPPGSRWLARVDRVAKDVLGVELLPGCAVVVSPFDATGDAATDLRTVFSVGEVVGVQVLPPANGRLHVRLPEGLDLQALPAGAVLPAGPPWLLPPEPLVEADDDPATSTEPEAVTDHPTGEAGALQAEIEALRARLAQADARHERLERERNDLRTQLRQAKAEARTALLRQEAALDGRLPEGIRLFHDPVEELTLRVRLAWASRTTADDKTLHPWRRFTFGDGFFALLDAVEGVDRDKLAEVVADIVCGRADTMHVYEIHQLRRGSGGDALPSSATAA